MKLIEKQKIFSLLIAEFLIECMHEGYEVTLGEAWRPEETAKFYANQGKGIVNSLHRVRLAIDLNFFKDGKFLTKTSDFERMGYMWESKSTADFECCWGGRFGDANHFSIEHNGIR